MGKVAHPWAGYQRDAVFDPGIYGYICLLRVYPWGKSGVGGPLIRSRALAKRRTDDGVLATGHDRPRYACAFIPVDLIPSSLRASSIEAIPRRLAAANLNGGYAR